MPISRPVILALIGAVLAAVTFLATSGARKEAVAPATPPDTPAVEKTQAKAPSKPAVKKAAPKVPAKPKVAGVPPSVARALAKKRIVVLFFRQPNSADDRAVARAVNAQRGRKGVSVFSDSISRLARYRAAVGQLGISQAPAVVIVGRNGQAQLVEGFVDEGSLTQQVVDAR